MSYHPLNQALRFILEISALVSLAIWGYSSFGSGLRILMAILAPLVFALLWGIFAVRGDPSRSGKTVIDVPGPVRLFLELILFSFSVLALYYSGYSALSFAFGAMVVLHYIISYDRVLWLMKKKGSNR